MGKVSIPFGKKMKTKNNQEREASMKLQEAIDWVDGTLDTYQTIQEDELVNDGTIKNNIKKVDKAWSLIRYTLRTNIK